MIRIGMGLFLMFASVGTIEINTNYGLGLILALSSILLMISGAKSVNEKNPREKNRLVQEKIYVEWFVEWFIVEVFTKK